MADSADKPGPKRPEGPVARGASPSEQDVLRATVRVGKRPTGETAKVEPAPRKPLARSGTSEPRTPTPAAVASLPPPQKRDPELDRLLDEGRRLFPTDPPAAHQLFEQAYRRNINDARVLSHYGLTLVVVEHDRQRGIRFCEEAVRRGHPTSEMLINLARALVETRNKEQAIRALRRAQELAPDDPRVQSEFVTLGIRRKPFIPFLPRGFFLNKLIGRYTWQMEVKRRNPGKPSSS